MPSVFPSEWKFRAREHYEIHSIKLKNGNTYKYKGFSNTINFGLEEAFKYYYALAAGPLLGGGSLDKGPAPLELDNKIKLFNLGLEAKYFILQELPGLFLRGGLGYNFINAGQGSADSSKGGSYYLGLGYEVRVKKLGIALEIATRQTSLSGNIQISSFTPSIGFHFYGM